MLNFGTKTNVGGVDDSRTTTKAGAKEQNSRNDELKNAVITTEQSLTDISTQDDTNVNQLAKAMGIYGRGALAFQDSGGVNTFQLTPVTGPDGLSFPNSSDGGYSLLNGNIVLFEAGNTNTGASTVNIGQTVGTLLGSKSIVSIGGTALTGGEIAAGQYIGIRYDLSNDYWEIISNSGSISVPDASETTKGIIELATQTETNTGTDTERAITPATLSGRAASETLAGVIELATQTEVNTGTDTTKAVTPATLAGADLGGITTRQVFTTSGTFVTPKAGTYHIWVAGAGGGGGAVGTGAQNGTIGGATTASSTTIGTITGLGGLRGYGTGAGATAAAANVGGSGGDYTFLGGGAAGGRGAAASTGSAQEGARGGLEYGVFVIPSGQTITITIGAGGSGGGPTYSGANGADGYVIIEY